MRHSHLLESKGIVKATDFLIAASNKKKSLIAVGSKVGFEGYLYPDTYQFHKPSTANKVLDKMVERFKERVSMLLLSKGQKFGLDPHQTLTLASLVEKETARISERSLISRVYINRLIKNMKMQCDPTIIYAQLLTHGQFGGDIKRSHIRFQHPYNTYKVKGLPPGPIANPSAATIADTVNPENSDALFFVSRNDGTHIFCPDYSCHSKAVKKWQIEFFRKKKKKRK